MTTTLPATKVAETILTAEHELIEAAEAIVALSCSSKWKDTPHTAVYIERLRAALGRALAPSEPKLVLALPDHETRRIVIASDEVIDGERLVCVAIEGESAVAPSDVAAAEAWLK